MNNSELELSRHEQAQSLHQQVMTSGALAAENLFNMAKALKDIRDGKFYKELGYGNFESYCEEMVGMKRHMAYKYVSILELKNVESIQHFGVTKLALLASLSEEKQAEVAETVDLESVSVRELKEEINRIKGEKLKLENEREKLNAKLKAEAANVEEARSDLERAEKELKIAQIKSAAEMDRANRTAVKLQDMQRDNARLERENKELRERPVEVAVVDNSDGERRIQETIRSLERENIKRNEEMDKRYIEERRDLEERKNKEVAAIRAEYEEKLRAAQDQSGEPDKEKQEFKILLVMAHDAVTRLVSFANSHDKRIYTEKAGDLLAASAAALKE